MTDEKTACIFYSGHGMIPASMLASLIYQHEDDLARVTADEEWPDGSDPQIRFEFRNMDREEADEIVTGLNEGMAESGTSDGEWWLAD